MATVDVALTRAVLKHGRLRPRNKFCGINAFRAWSVYRQMCPDEPSPFYVEGWCMTGVWHAWVQLEDGRVIDTTPVYMQNPDREYQPVVMFTMAEVLEYTKRGGLPMYGPGNLPHEED
jgi:hypothetical protein